MASKLYPIGIQNFEKLRKDGYCYIDKTEKIYKLVKTGSYYFLSCGISEEELLKNFSEDIQELASANGQTFDQACERLRTDYDGYHFCHGGIGIYNPFSLLNTFKSRQYGSYWFETGTPTYLVELLKKHKYDLYRMAHEKTTSDVLDSIDASSLPSRAISPSPAYMSSGSRTERWKKGS